MSAKTDSTAAELRADLARRFTTVSDIARDSDGMPYFTVTNGSLAAGQQQALIKVADLVALGVNSIGQSTRNYGHPVQIQVVTEALNDYTLVGPIDLNLTSNSILTAANMAKVLAAVLHRGVRTQVYMSAAGDSPDLDDITAAKLAIQVDLDEKYKTLLGV